MLKLHHFKLCPASRSIRLGLGELAQPFENIEHKPWEIGPELLTINPAGELPVVVLETGLVLSGSYAASEYFGDHAKALPAEPRAFTFFPGGEEDRAEVRRLVDWFHGKLAREATRELLYEKLYGRMRPGSGHTPDREIMRAAKSNLRYHFSYLSYLADQRRWLAGEQLSFADLAAAAQLSVIDYLGEAPWDEHPVAKAWYQRIKSRPSFRPLLADRQPGLPPPAHYANLDF